MKRRKRPDPALRVTLRLSDSAWKTLIGLVGATALAAVALWRVTSGG